MKLKRFLKQETVLSVAAVLAVLSMFFVPPDADYLCYIDLRTLAILFSLMTIMAGLRRQGVFDRMGQALLARTGSTLQLVLVLVGLCFFGSMIITNDVSLLTFVPFTFVVLSGLAPDTRRALTIPVVCMQTIAANLGSMLSEMCIRDSLHGRFAAASGGLGGRGLPQTGILLHRCAPGAAEHHRRPENHPAGCGAVCGLSAGGRPGIALRRCLCRCAGLYHLR